MAWRLLRPVIMAPNVQLNEEGLAAIRAAVEVHMMCVACLAAAIRAQSCYYRVCADIAVPCCARLACLTFSLLPTSGFVCATCCRFATDPCQNVSRLLSAKINRD